MREIDTGVQGSVLQDDDHDPIATSAKVNNPVFNRDLTADDQTFVSIGGTTDGLTALEGVPAINVQVGGYTQATSFELQEYCPGFIPAWGLVYMHYPVAAGLYDARSGDCVEGYETGGVSYYYYTYVYAYQPADFYGEALAWPAASNERGLRDISHDKSLR